MREFILSSEDLKDGKIWIVKLLYLSSLVETRIEARRMVSQGAFSIDHKRYLDINEEIAVRDGMIMKVGNFLSARLTIV